MAKKWPSRKKEAKKSNWPKTGSRPFFRDGERQETADWCVRICAKGRQETFNPATPSAEAAALRALKIYKSLIDAGWEATRTEHKPAAAAKPANPASTGANGWSLSGRLPTSGMRP